MLNKLKSLVLDDTIYMAFLLVLVATGSFGLGVMSAHVPVENTVTVTESALIPLKSTEIAPVENILPTNASGKETLSQPIMAPKQNFVGSKSGSKYHKLSCPGAKQIKDTNKIFFATEVEAEASGYTRAANCKF